MAKGRANTVCANFTKEKYLETVEIMLILYLLTIRLLYNENVLLRAKALVCFYNNFINPRLKSGVRKSCY